MSTNVEILKQAVILAGGRGARLKPLTDTIPKPMIRFSGKPFLEYLVEQLRDQGIQQILLLLGYLPQVIQEYFGDGSKYGIRIDYSVTDVTNDTGRRLKLVKDQIQPYFLFLYCDNYWPMRIADMWQHFLTTGTMAQITVYTNKDNYTRNNIRVNNDRLVVHYDKSRMTLHLQGVEIGYALLKKDVLEMLPDENVNFEQCVYPRLVEQRNLSAYLTDHRYYSVGSFQRLPLTEAFLQRQPTIILDRDGVLNKKPPKAQYVTRWEEFCWLPGAKEALRLLRSAGYRIIVVSNQAGIARGMMSESDLAAIHARMKAEAAESGGTIDAIYYCPHGWEDECECRKPKPGMIFQAQRDFHLDLCRTFFVGDDIRDKQAGDAAGCPTLLVSSDVSLFALVNENILNMKAGEQ